MINLAKYLFQQYQQQPACSAIPLEQTQHNGIILFFDFQPFQSCLKHFQNCFKRRFRFSPKPKYTCGFLHAAISLISHLKDASNDRQSIISSHRHYITLSLKCLDKSSYQKVKLVKKNFILKVYTIVKFKCVCSKSKTPFTM